MRIAFHSKEFYEFFMLRPASLGEVVELTGILGSSIQSQTGVAS